MLLRLLLDGIRADNRMFSDAGWSALLLTTLVVLAVNVLFPAFGQASGGLQIAFGGLVQLLGTLAIAGMKFRMSQAQH